MPKQKVLTVKQQVYKIIKDDIRNGVYKPGQQINEVELSNRLNISRSPIRESLRQLVSDGLAVEYPNRGVFVKRFSVEEIENIYDFRVLIESYAIEECSKLLNDQMIKQLNGFKRSLNDLYNRGDLENYIDEDESFHHTIVDLCGNSIIIDAYDRVSSMNKQFRIYSLISKQRYDESIDEHTGIIDNILNGNYDEAIALNKVHLSKAKKTATTEIEKQLEKEKATVK